MVWNLLKKNISVGQIAGYAVANFVGLAIVLTAIRFYSDVSSTFSDEDSFVKTDYLIISKPVPLLAALGGGSSSSTTFSEADIEELRSQPWVKKVGVFRSADFDVSASLDIQGRHMSTALFFEAIPSEFYDSKAIDGDQWHFDPASPNPQIPIIISKDYLTLYNFGFAAARGYPQLSEDLISKVPITISVVGNGHYDRFPARIVGFSSRLNTIAVPEDFLDWANERYREPDRPTENPSRLIVEVNSPGDPAIGEYFARNGIEIAGDKNNNSRAVYLMTVITTIVIIVGAIISLLSFFILMLSIYLLMQKSREKLRDLMLLGYSPQQICMYYYRLVGGVNAGILLLAVVVMLIGSCLWQPALESLKIAPSTPWLTIAVGIAIMALITSLNFLTIRRLVRKCF